MQMTTMASSDNSNELDKMSSHSLGEFLESMDTSGHDVDDILDELARDIDENQIGQDFASALSSDRRGSNSSIDLDPATMEAISGSLEESLARFDDFLARANDSGGFGELDDELTELRPIETVREKRSRDYGNGNMHSGAGMSPRIRSISGEKLSSMPPMHRGFATTSSLHKKSNTENAAQKNETWDTPEPVLGEVTGNKMRRLLSDKSYFQSRPPLPSDASKNAPWNQPKAAPTTDARTAMQFLLNSGSGGTSKPVSQAAQTTQTAGGPATSGWPSQQQTAGLSSITLSQMQQLANSVPNFNNSQATAAVPQQATRSEPVQQPAFITMSIQDMQRLVASGASFFGTQGSNTTTGFTSQAQGQTQAAPWMTPKPTFASVSLQDMQRLASSGITFPHQTTQATPNFSQQNAAANQTSVSMQDMQRLAASRVAQPTQAAPAATNAGQNASMPPPKPMFASVSLQEMQRLAGSGVAISNLQAAQSASTSGSQNATQQAPTPPWAAAQKPAFAGVSLQDMQRLASTGASFLTQTAPKASSSGVQVPPWAVSAPTPATETSTMQNMQLSAASAANPDPFGKGAQSFCNVRQAAAAAAPKPGFATVSLEDMQLLARTGVKHPTVPRAPLQQPAAQNALWNAPKPPTQTSSSVSTQQSTATSTPSVHSAPATGQSAPKPTFASVTLDDMQRLNDAYRSHSSQQAPSAAVPASATQNTPPAPLNPTPDVVSVEEMQQVATQGNTGSTPTTHSSESKSQSQNEAWQPVKNFQGDGGAQRNMSITSITSDPKDEIFKSIDDSTTPPQRVSGGALQRMMSEPCYFQNTDTESAGSTNAAWPSVAVSSSEATGKQLSDSDSDGSGTPSEESRRLPSDPDEMLKRLRKLASKSSSTQQALQEFDKKRGLPRSHSQTMVNSSRSRKQIIEGKIIAKWDGSPLISDEHELGKPKPRAPKKKNQEGQGPKTGDSMNITAPGPVTSV